MFFGTEHLTDHLASEVALSRRLFPDASLHSDDRGWSSLPVVVIDSPT
jgi:hypothetical protein